MMKILKWLFLVVLDFIPTFRTEYFGCYLDDNGDGYTAFPVNILDKEDSAPDFFVLAQSLNVFFCYGFFYKEKSKWFSPVEYYKLSQ
jgi:hypothetical protein